MKKNKKEIKFNIEKDKNNSKNLIICFDYFHDCEETFSGVKILFDTVDYFLRVDEYLTPRKIKQLFKKKLDETLVSLSFVGLENYKVIAEKGISAVDNTHCKWLITYKTFRKIKKHLGRFIVEPQKMIVHQ